VTSGQFNRSELAAAFENFEQTVARAAEARDWNAWVEQYTADIEYVEHAAGTMKGRDEVRTWIRNTMTTFPGSHMIAFPSRWSVIDEPTGRIICELDNLMVDPGDGTIIRQRTSRSSLMRAMASGVGRKTSITRCALCGRL
jgi:SnoaL-like domain